MHQKTDRGYFWVGGLQEISSENVLLGLSRKNVILFFPNPKHTFHVFPNAVSSMEVPSPPVGTESPGGVSGPGERGPGPRNPALPVPV